MVSARAQRSRDLEAGMTEHNDRTKANSHEEPAPPALQIMEAALGYNHHGLAVLPLHSPG